MTTRNAIIQERIRKANEQRQRNIEKINTHNENVRKRKQEQQQLREKQTEYKEKYPETYDKLKNIQDSLTLRYGTFLEEYPEQIMSVRFLNGTERVLEIGGNIGRNSLIIACVLNSYELGNDRFLITMESDEDTAKKLEENKNINGLGFFVEPSALSLRRLIQKNGSWDTTPSDVLLDNHKWVNVMTFQELEKKYNITFDTLVLDCEGAFYDILKDMPDIITNIKKVIMENDYQKIEKKNYVNSVLKENGFRVVYSEAGGWGDCYDFFYEVWER